MWLVFLLFILILGIYLSKVEIAFKEIKIQINKSTKFKIKCNLKFFGILKIFSITFNEAGIKIFNKIISYEKIPFKEEINKFKFDIEEFDISRIINEIKKVNARIDKAKFALKIGADNILVTNIIIVFVSTIIALFFRHKTLNFNSKNINYKILPEFNNLLINFEGLILISIPIKEILKKLIINFKKQQDNWNRKLKIEHNN